MSRPCGLPADKKAEGPQQPPCACDCDQIAASDKKMASGASRGTCKEAERPVYVFLRFRTPLVQDMKNSLIKTLSIHPNYTGSVVGLCTDVKCFEGTWPKQLGIAVLKFECMTEGKKWLASTPEVKQRDWIDGVDMVGVPCRINPPTHGRRCFEVMEIYFSDNKKFMDSYVPKTDAYLKKNSAEASVVSTSNSENLRGNWMCSNGRPSYMVVNQFDSEDHFCKVYQSEEYRPLKALRNECSDCKIFVFTLESLTTGCKI